MSISRHRRQVAKPGSRTLSRWRHGFEPRWDYQQERRSGGLSSRSGESAQPFIPHPSRTEMCEVTVASPAGRATACTASGRTASVRRSTAPSKGRETRARSVERHRRAEDFDTAFRVLGEEDGPVRRGHRSGDPYLARRFAGGADEILEARRRRHHQQPRRLGGHDEVVLDAARPETEHPLGELLDVLADLQFDLSFKDIEDLVVVRVDVKRRTVATDRPRRISKSSTNEPEERPPAHGSCVTSTMTTPQASPQ
jgi:hypothetical protein